MIEKIIVGLLNVAIKLFAAWVAYLLAKWIQAPEWATMALIVMAVQSSFVRIRRS